MGANTIVDYFGVNISSYHQNLVRSDNRDTPLDFVIYDS